MKKLLAMLLLAALILTCTACGQSAARIPEEGRSSLEIYSNFTNQLRSGTLSKVHIGRSSWYDAVTSQSETVQFSTREDGARLLLYRNRTPFVFWYYPSFDYYDGEQYYYKYQGSWFIDRTGKFNNVNRPDFLGLQESFLIGNDVFSDAVYQEVKGYTLETTMQSPDRTRYYTLIGKTDLNFQFSKIDVKGYAYDFEKQEFMLTDTYHFRYRDVNLDIPVAVPAGLDPNAVENQLMAQ